MKSLAIGEYLQNPREYLQVVEDSREGIQINTDGGNLVLIPQSVYNMMMHQMSYEKLDGRHIPLNACDTFAY